MTPLIFFFLFLLFAPSIQDDCKNGTWSYWYLSDNQTGYDYCGSCWLGNYERYCVSAADGCACIGVSTMIATVISDACPAPREPCCPPATLQPDGKCSSPQALPLDDEECSTYGNWAPWGSWGICSATCGMCGVRSRNRTCYTAEWDVPCYSSIDGDWDCMWEPCGAPICPGETPCCGDTAVVTGYDGSEYCSYTGLPPPSCTGSWTEWQASPGALCNGTCGLCGSQEQVRFCLPSGCICEGERSRQSPCGEAACPYPQDACCSPHIKKLSGGIVICIESAKTCDEWTAFSPCSESCGLCGNSTRTRTCTSGSNSTIETDSILCEKVACPYPRDACCNGTKKLSSGLVICD